MNKNFKIIILIFLIFFSTNMTLSFAEEKLKIGILVPLTGNNKELGQSIIKATKMALKDINNSKLEIYPKDTFSNPDQTLKSALELKEMGVKIIIGPIFYNNLSYLLTV